MWRTPPRRSRESICTRPGPALHCRTRRTRGWCAWTTYPDPTIYIIPAAQSQNLEQVSAYPALRIEQTGFTGTTHLTKLAGSAIATAEKRWAGVNRGGWLNPEYDRLVDVFLSSLDRAERNRAAVDAL